MWALVEDNAITKLINNPKGLVIENTRYSKNIFSFRWTNEEREAIGIYEVVFDNSNKKDEAYYINTNQSFDYADGEVTASYGTATPKKIEDTLYTSQDKTDDLIPSGKDVGDVKIKGLKTLKKEIIKNKANNLLAPTDWYVLKATDVEDYSVPSAISTFRTNVRTRSNEMEAAIDNASNIDALATLYTYVNTGTEENPVMERPLGEFPILEI